jgi:hypothetical protein
MYLSTINILSSYLIVIYAICLLGKIINNDDDDNKIRDIVEKIRTKQDKC